MVSPAMLFYSILIVISLVSTIDSAEDCIYQYYNTPTGIVTISTNNTSYCIFIYISVPNGNFVSLNCTKFTSSSSYSTLIIYDGSQEYDRQLYSHLGKRLIVGKIVNSSQNEMLISLRINNNWDANDIYVQFVYKKFPALTCSCPTRVFTGSYGTIYSPLHKKNMNYCNNLDCSYKIEIYEKLRISIQIQSFFTEKDKDVLTLIDGRNQRQIGNYSGRLDNIIRPILTGSNVVTLRFTTNSQKTHYGFVVAYKFYQEKCTCPETNYVDPQGELLSPGYPEPGLQCVASPGFDIQGCYYRIIGSAGQTVFLNFTELRLANGSFLAIYDHSTVMANYTWPHNENGTMDQLTSELSRVILYVHMDLFRYYNENQTLFIVNYWLVDHPKQVSVLMEIVLSIVAVIGVVVFIVIFCIIHQKRKRDALIGLMTTFNAARNQTVATNDYDETSMEDHVDDLWQISHNDISIDLGDLLGRGAFGSVYKAKLNAASPLCQILSSYYHNKFTNCTVAVKMLGELANIHSKEAFLEEILCMKSVGYCQYLVNMHGYSIKNNDYWLVLEYCAGGDLLTYVRNCAQNQDSIDEFDSFAWQIASGMEYLTSKQLVHRDLAARNVLLDEEKRAKIGDFGLCRQLSRDVYVTHGGRLPIKWMAIESIKDHLFTSKSDVWSYGVLLYEIYSFGNEPFDFVAPRDMLQLLLDGERLEKPDLCSDKIYNLMKLCWNESWEDRPTFEDIKRVTAEHITEMETADSNYLELDNA